MVRVVSPTKGVRLVGSAVSPGQVFPFLSGAGPSPLYLGGEPALIQEEIVRLVLYEIAYSILPRGMALTGRPSNGMQDGDGAAGGGPPALGR